MRENPVEIISTWFEEVWNKGRREAVEELLAPGAVLHDGGAITQGTEGFYAFFDRMHAAFSDIHVTVRDGFSNGNKGCVRWTCRMTHTGPGMGVPATGKILEVTGISIVRVADGKLIEGWQNWDMLQLMDQIRGLEAVRHTYIATA